MNLGRTTIGLLTIFIVASLVGLLALQYVLIENAYELKQQVFRQNVKAAMGNIVQKIETGETVGNTFRILVKGPPSEFNIKMFTTREDSAMSVSVIENSHNLSGKTRISDSVLGFSHLRFAHPPIRWDGEKVWYTTRSPQHVLLRAYNHITGKDTVIVNAFKSTGEHSVDIDSKMFEQGAVTLKFLSDSLSYTMEVMNGKSNEVSPNRIAFERREEIVGQVVDKLFLAEQTPIEDRLRQETLDSVIRGSFKESGIELPYAYGVISERNDSVQLVQPANYKHELQASEFKARLFPNDFSISFNQLALYFPGEQMYLMRQIAPLLTLTVVFMGIIVYCFVSTVRMIVKQKQLSQQLTDFINNMTHEFKTPISTIAVSVDTMMHPDVIVSEEKLKRYGSVIQDENQRMKHQVDKILQMAVLEEGTSALKRVSLDVHEVLGKAVDNISLQVTSKGGSVNYEPRAERSHVNVDAVHFANIINNVLDNANKYTPEHPEITITTGNEGNTLLITIADNGIGISEADQHRVFEKYFRVHTGNVHDVKGFGLGLSYVKLMTEAHGGQIALKSKPGEGTTVTLSFPLLEGIDL